MFPNFVGLLLINCKWANKSTKHYGKKFWTSRIWAKWCRIVLDLSFHLIIAVYAKTNVFFEFQVSTVSDQDSSGEWIFRKFIGEQKDSARTEKCLSQIWVFSFKGRIFVLRTVKEVFYKKFLFIDLVVPCVPDVDSGIKRKLVIGNVCWYCCFVEF